MDIYKIDYYLSLTLLQVDINEAGMSKILDDNGDIGREDFIKFSQDSKLLDFGNLMGEVGVKTLATYPYTIKNQRKTRNAPNRGLWVP